MLSIILPVRNESDNIMSIYNYFSNNLKNLDYEVIIVNDFSNDNTIEQVRTLSNKDNRFKFFDNKKKG